MSLVRFAKRCRVTVKSSELQKDNRIIYSVEVIPDDNFIGSPESDRIMENLLTNCQEVLLGLEDCAENLLMGHAERIAALRRMKDLYEKITGWNFVADPNRRLK